MILITLKRTLKTQTVLYLFFIWLNSCCHPLSTLVRNLGLFSATSRLCQACNFRLVGSVLCITISLMMLSRFSSVLLFCFVSIIVIHPSLAATRSWTVFQNSAAHLICSSHIFDHVSPILRAVHWLPVESCVLCKILPLTDVFILNNSAPSYLSYISHAAVCSVSPTPLVCRHSTPSSSADTLLLRLLSADLKSYGRRDFFLEAQYYSGTTYFTVYFGPVFCPSRLTGR